MSEAYQPMLKGEEMDSVGLHYRGQSTILDVDKHFIMRRVHIHARYLRILGSMLLHPSTILGGEKVIVPNLEALFSFLLYGLFALICRLILFRFCFCFFFNCSYY